MRRFIHYAIVSSVVLGFPGSSLAVAPKPNVLLIISDDQGYRDLGCYGARDILTPNLDRLARDGVRLTNFYVTWPACTPSRGSLLTGRYPQRNGMYDMVRNEAPDYGHRYTPEQYRTTFERVGGMDTREVLLPAMLRSSGYVSGIFGKWDLGIHKRFLPLARGFDEFYGFVNTGIDYYTHERYGVPSMYRNNEPTQADKGTYATTLFKQEALRFLEDHGDRPFFLYVPFNAPHSTSNLDPPLRASIQAPEEALASYPTPPGPHTQKRRYGRYGQEAMIPTSAVKRWHYMGAVTAMDDAIGTLLNELDRQKIADRTIVMFLSDNGGGVGSDNTPLRGKKGRMFEGGIRVPCLVRWPGRIQPKTVCDAFLTTLEILPTLCAAAGATPPADITLDGFDMLPILQGSRPSPRTEMFWQRRGDKAARVGPWKWVESSAGNGLFDLSKDIGEQSDLSQANPEKLAELKARFAAWQKAMDAAEPRGPFRDY